MSERLEQLAARLDSIPEPSDMMQQATLSLLKVLGKTVARVPDDGEDVQTKTKTLATVDETINTAAEMLGERHDGIIIARKMKAIALANVEGRREPTDDELNKEFGGSGAGGCLSVLLMIGVGLALEVALVWT